MRRGYRAALKRWRFVDTRSLFDEIEAEADRRLKHAEEGYKLHVRLKFERAMITDARYVDVKIWMDEGYDSDGYPDY